MLETALLLPTFYQSETFSEKKRRKKPKDSASDNQNAQEVDAKALEYIIISIQKQTTKIQQLAFANAQRARLSPVLMVVKNLNGSLHAQ